MTNMNKKIRELACYLICGCIAAVLNLTVFWFLDSIIKINYIFATLFAWLCSTTFAFLTNKFIVFKSDDTNFSVIIKESRNFIYSRFISGAMDVFGMYLLVEKLTMEHNISKLIVLLIIVTNNYILSKYWVFK